MVSEMPITHKAHSTLLRLWAEEAKWQLPCIKCKNEQINY